MKNPKKSDSSMASRVKINYLLLKLLPLIQTLNIIGSKLMPRKVIRPLLLKASSESRTLIQMHLINFLCSKWPATIQLIIVLSLLITYQERLLMFLEAPESTDKD